MITTSSVSSTRARVKHKHNNFRSCVLILRFTSAYIYSKNMLKMTNKFLFLIILTVLFAMQNVEQVEYQQNHVASNYIKMYVQVKKCRPRAGTDLNI